jgi:hypothetical protein
MGGGRPVGWPPFHFALVDEDEIGAAEGAIVASLFSRHGRDWTGPPYRRVVHLPAM